MIENMATRSNRRRVLALGALLALTGVIGCGDGENDRATTDDLAGHTFASTAVEGHTLVDGTVVTLSFVDDLIVANAGCNSMFTELQIDDGRLDIETLAQTMMACEGELQSQDEWLAGFLTEGPEVSLDDGVLTLTTGSATLTLQENG